MFNNEIASGPSYEALNHKYLPFLSHAHAWQTITSKSVCCKFHCSWYLSSAAPTSKYAHSNILLTRRQFSSDQPLQLRYLQARLSDLNCYWLNIKLNSEVRQSSMQPKSIFKHDFRLPGAEIFTRPQVYTPFCPWNNTTMLHRRYAQP